MGRLKNCPFCGSDSVHPVIPLAEGLDPYIVCEGCGAQTAPHKQERKARRAWNRREVDARTKEARQAVVDNLKQLGIW